MDENPSLPSPKNLFFMDRDERTEYLLVLFWTLLVQSGGLRQSYLTNYETYIDQNRDKRTVFPTTRNYRFANERLKTKLSERKKLPLN